MRVLFVSMHYRPEPCDTRTSVLAQELVKRGWRATALTSFPNYPFGKVYDGYRQRLVARETIEGVEVVRMPMVPDHSKSVLRRAVSYLSFLASAASLGLMSVGKTDLVWIHHPPLTTGLAGWFIARCKRVPFVYEIHDLWPETLVSTGMVKESLATRLIRSVCRFLHSRADAVIVTSEGMKRHLVTDGLSEAKIHVVPQWADECAITIQERCSRFAALHGLEDTFNVVFTGNVGKAQKLEVLLRAALRLRQYREIQFLIVGDGVERSVLEDRAKAIRLNNVRFVGQVARTDLAQYYAWADALVVHLKRDPLFSITVPSKTQTYLYAGRPVLCAMDGDTASVIKKSGAGVVCASEDPDALARAVIELSRTSLASRTAMGQAGQEYYHREFSISSLIPLYERLFERVVRGEVEEAAGLEPSEFERAA